MLNIKIMAFSGSPRKNGNTEILIKEIFKGAMNFESETVRLYPKRIEPCMDCRKCKAQPYVCPINDDMRELYPKIDQSDIVVFGTPIYYYGPTAKTKLLIDRLRPYIANKKLHGKKAAVVLPSEEGPLACQTTVKMFKMSFKYMGMGYIGEIYGTAYEKGEIINNPNELKLAYQFGERIDNLPLIK